MNSKKKPTSKTIQKMANSLKKSPIKKKKKTLAFKPEKKPVGTPTKYKPEFADIAKRLAAKGLIDKDIYDALGISEVTGISYKKKFPDFLKSINEGKAEPNRMVEQKLLERALGFEYKAEKALVVSDGIKNGSHVEVISNKEYALPDVGAMKFWLNNRNPERWKDKQTINLNNEDGEPFIIEIK